MNEVLSQILISSAVAAISASAGYLWKSAILPRLEEFAYSDARFEGEWEAEETFFDTVPPLIDKFSIEFKRVGSRVTGKSVCYDGPDKGKTYLLEGSYKNLILTLRYSPLENHSIESGTLAARLVKSGSCFEGHGLFYSPETEKVHYSDFKASRKS